MNQLVVDRMKDGEILLSGDFGHMTQRVYKTPCCTFRILEIEFDGKCKDEFRIKFGTRPETMLLNYCSHGIFLFERGPGDLQLVAQTQCKLHGSLSADNYYYRVRPGENVKHVLFSMNFYIPGLLKSRLKKIIPSLKDAKELTATIDMQKQMHDILDELENTFFDCRRLKACLDILMLEVTEHYFHQLLHSSSITKDLNPEERMAYLLAENIILGIDEPWTIEKLADSGQITIAKLKSLFKKFIGQPAAAFRISVRMQKAKQLLLDKRVNIQEISMQVGYSSPGQFASMFRRKTGCSPSEFRKKGAFNSGET